MGGKVNKKDPSLKGANQRKHNPNTRGINTKKRGPLWAIMEVTHKDKKGNEERYIKEVRIPPGLQWDPFDKTRWDKADEPFAALQLDWKKELMHYAADYDARIGKIDMPDGSFAYRVFYGDTVHNPEVLFLEVFSNQKLLMEKGRKFRPGRPVKVG